MEKDLEGFQTIKCQCGNMFAACKNGHQDNDFHLEVGDYISNNKCTSQIESSVSQLKKCECPDMDGSLKGQEKIDFD